ncbi:MAG: AAA family ATPase [Colwellia sp.]|uniref:AAA family ATPase n=1 Tax=Colwellia sp. TaxID=56799 RepID=UPI001DD5F632|nr:AAA family ATPase [Colwellia sp.]NQY48376.1 AAA family ATPase [Colwellia sp.]
MDSPPDFSDELTDKPASPNAEICAVSVDDDSVVRATINPEPSSFPNAKVSSEVNSTAVLKQQKNSFSQVLKTSQTKLNDKSLAVTQDKNTEQGHNLKQAEDALTNTAVMAKRPSTIKETGLSEQLLLQLLIKHILVAHVVGVRLLAEKMALSGGIIQNLLDNAKSLNWLENRQSSKSGQMRYALSALGATEAEKAFNQGGYLGMAPVPLQQYSNLCIEQTSRNTVVVKELLQQRFSQLMFSPELISTIGPALNSTKPILIYGAPGVGKSYLCRHLNLLFGDDVLIPAAIEINNIIIQVYDPQLHILSTNGSQHDNDDAKLVSLAQGYDPRWHLCQRPLLVTGGELTAAMLEVNFDATNRTYKAPLQLKANNGILLLDDLGRQKISPVELFNRWIIPLEERRDFLSLPNGLHFEIPFELILLFSTNLAPQDLVDEAFLRRLGYKIKFEALSVELYEKLWIKTCAEYRLDCDHNIFNYLVEQHHYVDKKDFLPCLPRDLLSIVSDQIKFNQLTPVVTQELLCFAWQHYFVKALDNKGPEKPNHPNELK